MTKRDFENEVKAQVKRDGAKVVDIDTKQDIDIVTDSMYYYSVVYVFRNHVCYRYLAYQNTDETVTVKYNKCCC